MAEVREFPNSQSKGDLDAVIGLAAPKDRLAAYILDCALLLPLVQLVQSPFRKWILESFLFNEGLEVPTYKVMNLVIFISLFIIYYSIMIAWKGQTLGKMFFGVKVISYHGKITPLQSFLRSSFMFVEFVSCGIPFLAIFSHNLRRPLHDRVADTLVISEKNPVSFPTEKESWRAQFVGGVGVFFLATSIMIYVSVIQSGSDTSIALKGEELCNQQTGDVNNNLEKVLELHLLEKVSSDCLYDFARDQLWVADQQGSSIEKALAQFAMATALREEEEQSNVYLAEVCNSNGNHHLCDLSRWLIDNSKGERKNLEKFYTTVEKKNLYNFVRVFLAARLNELKEYGRADTLLKPIEQPGILQPVVASLSFHSLLGQLKWDEAYWVYRTHDSVGDQSILYFMQLELKKSRLSTQQQLQLLDYFYPKISERAPRREPASILKIPAEIRDIYRILERRL